MAGFTFDEQMIVDALEANGWSNAWDIYWINPSAPGWGALTADDAFQVLLGEERLLPRSNSPPASPEASQRR
jgi:hypothetical protein